MKKTPPVYVIPMFVTAAAVVLCGQSAAYADCAGSLKIASSYEVSTNIPFTCKLSESNSSYAASIKNNLRINNSNYLLYPTFDNSEKAIEAIQTDAHEILNLLSSTYNLEELSSCSWEQYRDAMLDMLNNADKPDWYVETSEEYEALFGFFDLYENASNNAEIKLLFNSVEPTSVITSENEEVLETLDLLLPDQKALGNEQAATLADLTMPCTTVLGFNIGKGLAYAKEYATKPNTKIYRYFSNGDCANFASQILEAGGVEQVNKSPDKTSGWWHIHNINNAFNPHTHSRSWTEAKTFAKYMGVTYSTKSNKAFSANIRKGDFIAFDKNSDGDYDHIGFVTGVATSKTGNYYPYKVAQHTSNYNEWTTSDTNNWEKLGAQGYTYARVRR